MSYMGDGYFTRKQCNILYKAFKNNELTPPKDYRGKVKSPGFVYSYEGRHYYCGMRLTADEMLSNFQLSALNAVIKRYLNGDIEEAQAIFDLHMPAFLIDKIPEGVSLNKLWKST